MTDRLNNINIVAALPLPTPAEVKGTCPLSPTAERTVLRARDDIRAILDGRDPRLFAVVGPCSVHDIGEVEAYAERLHSLATELVETFVIVMRVYFEKPRTVTGWKGFINDPNLDDTFDLAQGLRRARRFLVSLAEAGMPVATEALDPITPQYIGDLIAWTAIGARTTESQTHREMASGLSTPVGFKNGTDGNIAVAINALQSAQHPHHFLGVTDEAQCAVFHTRGNPYGHIVLRGGKAPNYDAVSVGACERQLVEAGLPTNIMIDCSHANSNRDPAQQSAVLTDVVRQVVAGNRSIVGVMIESNLAWGKQALPADGRPLQPGVSVTDACVDWDTTERMLRGAADALAAVVPARRR